MNSTKNEQRNLWTLNFPIILAIGVSAISAVEGGRQTLIIDLKIFLSPSNSYIIERR